MDGFVAKAVKLADDVVLRKRMGAAARESACEATWDKINNKVAWRMTDTIQERERDQGKQPPQSPVLSPTAQQLVPVYGWLMMNNGLREAMARSIIDARLMGGLGVIMTFWAVTGCYVLFTECLLWAKGRMRAGERKVV
jgi:hypothetical protein